MGKYIVTILAILFAFLLGFGGYIYFQGQEENTTPQIQNIKVDLQNKSNLELLLADSGWYSADKVTLLSGREVEINQIGGIEVIYTDREQPFLKQGDGNGMVFASVNAEFTDKKLVFTIHVDPKKLTEAQDKNWWINHQVIRALNKMLNPNATDEILIEKDREMFDKYKGKIDLWQISF